MFLRVIVVTAAVLGAGERNVLAQPDWGRVDNYARSISESELIRLTDTLTAPWTTDLEKVRAMFVWITENIAYDCNGANARDPEADAVTHPLYDMHFRLRLVLKNRRARCSGYAFLFKTMCDLAGIQSRIIEGKASQGRRSEGHAWNVVLLDGFWRPIDLTWASGACDDNERFHKIRDETYFLPDPQVFMQNHSPTETEWNLLTQPD